MTRPLRILIGCETSGIARLAFDAQGHDVWSCDIAPAEDGSNRHILCDIRDGILEWGWDLLVVMHPPCTRLCRSGRRWMSGPGKWTQPKKLPKGRSLDDLRTEFELGVSVFTACWNAPIECVAIENPEMNDLAKDRMPEDLPRPQMVQPFWFGEPTYKSTGWYLRALPELVETNRLTEPKRNTDDWKRWNRIHRMPPGPDRARLRSRSFPGMMTAAANQWTAHTMERIAA
ncbi:hypothetical protein DS909_01645 [Phaeobacter gallaeciensis]|uniref:DNA cytosine methyltransferase n=2 Tax=Roseobacteraceae TaxID=2854170 RepID=A0A366XB05_9RHOB|nr:MULTISPECIES: hypothetical protein [Roseobacteraceae]MBT3142810.1 hypothetical protein [Falsiruegeria litorea]RBW61444.1 hypothetical protein DS909_01645 [Phaeobacter gallaeciensis]